MTKYNNIEDCVNKIKSIDIDKLCYDKISIDELYDLSKELYMTYLYEDLNKFYLLKAEEVAKKIIDRCKSADSYRNYLQILKLSNQYSKAYDICSNLLNNNYHIKVALDILNDLGFVVDGVITYDEYLNYLKLNISHTKNSEGKSILMQQYEKERYSK